MKLEYIAELIHGNGQITLGTVGPAECAAVASDEARCLAMLVRHPGESLTALLMRLDAAIEAAVDRNEIIDEING